MNPGIAKLATWKISIAVVFEPCLVDYLKDRFSTDGAAFYVIKEYLRDFSKNLKLCLFCICVYMCDCK